MSYFEKGMLDIVTQDRESLEPIQLMHSKVELNQQTLKNPLCLVANYVFDSTKCDAFSVRQGKLYELLASFSTEASNLANGKPIDLSSIEVDYYPNEVHGDYYGDPVMDALLGYYKEVLHGSHFLIPSGAIRYIDRLSQLANHQLLLISSDKAYSDISALDSLGSPSISFQGGAFSTMVNYHAIGQYLSHSGGDFHAQTTRRGIKTGVFTSGFKIHDLPETRVAVMDHVEHFSPSDYFNVYRHMMDSVETMGMDAIASALELSRWDPQVYLRMSARILVLVNEADADTVRYIADNLYKVAENYYYIPHSECVLFEIAVFFHALKRYEEAISYYRPVEKFLGEQFSLCYNTALCLHHLDKNKEALLYFRRSLALDSDSKEAKDWISHLEKLFIDKKYEPKSLFG
jgi:tetratricopeptide (TPR) repeat protein